MKQLPTLHALHRSWQLPLSSSASVRWVHAWLSRGGAERQQRFEQLLVAEPVVLLWSICHNAVWSKQAPCCLGQVANWLADWSQHWSSAAPPPDASRATQGGTDASVLTACVGEHHEIDWATLIVSFGNLATWLSAHGDAVTWDDLTHGRSCLPHWLAALAKNPTNNDAASSCEEMSSQKPQPKLQSGTSSEPKLQSGTSSDAAISDGLAQQPLPTLELDRLGPLLAAAQATELTRLQDRLAALRELAYGASHEINNPLANIATRAQTLLRDEPNAERRRTLATIAAQAMRAFDMIADLMLFAKPPALRPAWISLPELLQRALHEWEAAAAEQGIAVELKASGPLVDATNSDAAPATNSDRIWADREQLLVALSCLGTNAIEAVSLAKHQARQPHPARITVAYRPLPTTPSQAQAGWEIRVRDNGPGIAPDLADKIFDPFFSGREAGRGLGFGLSKAWRIIDMHGGTLRLLDPASTSQPEPGSEFVVWLPTRSSRDV